MKTVAVKTNIMCAGCVAKISPALNESLGEGNWQVLTRHPNKVLSVSTGSLSGEEIIKVVEKAGFKAEKLS